jgi:hypothetical protein
MTTAGYKRTTRDQLDGASGSRVRVGNVLTTDISPTSFTESIPGAIRADLSK